MQITMYFCNQNSSLFHNEKLEKKGNLFRRNSSKRRKEKEKRDTGKKEKKGKKGDHCQTAAAAQD